MHLPQQYAAQLCEVFMYALLLAVIYLAFVSLGLPDTLLGFNAGMILHSCFSV